MTTDCFEFREARSPLMLSIPHAGTEIPPEIEERLSDAALVRRDTDWFLKRLYDFEELETAGRIAANYSRYVVDLNRSSDNKHLYPGQNTTGLCPVTTFAGKPLYRKGQEPGESEIAERVSNYWKPYHDQLHGELSRIVETFGFAVLLDGHSIANQIPRLFEGQLPDFNFGTNRGQSCSEAMQKRIDEFAESIDGYSAVVNERFVGGFITRNYGSLNGVNAVQVELSQVTYMDQDALTWKQELAEQVQVTIRAFVRELQNWIETER